MKTHRYFMQDKLEQTLYGCVILVLKYLDKVLWQTLLLRLIKEHYKRYGILTPVHFFWRLTLEGRLFSPQESSE